MSLQPHADFPTRYPHLFQEVTWPWGPTLARFTLLSQAPPAELIANVNLVPRVKELWGTIQLSDGSWDIPGGTLEPGETYLEAIRRELMEESGAELVSCQVIGAWQCRSLTAAPYRPHLPHPEFYRLVLLGEVRILSQPLNPAGAESVARVTTAPLATVVRQFVSQGRLDLAELYQLAGELA